MALSIYVIGFNNTNSQVLEEIAVLVSEAFNANVRALSDGSVPSEFIDTFRNQYRAEEVLNWVYGKWGGERMVLAIIEGDGYVEGLNFVFGVASPQLNVALVFTYRLKLWIRSEDISRHVFIERLRKEVMHEIGHVLGLRHCSNPSCVMFFSNTIFDTDRKTWKYCSNCAKKLRSLGVVLSHAYVLDRSVNRTY
ncbi:MAG: archaemetzincin family Zn-dependent metalloprotease [Desulfurococcales archaeon]|nr:archaemetzincin family Zn-dependent metalloprotease [Desulfurococcales archaeon]